MKTDLISRRSFLSVVGAVGAAAALTACSGAVSSTASSAAASSEAASSEAAGESVELIVFAAASLTETLNAIAQDYSAENPGVTFRFNFDSSGTLKTQIQEGADCDLFLSAGQKQMNQLDITASADVNTDGLDFVDPSTRVDLLENKVVLCVPEGSGKGIEGAACIVEQQEITDLWYIFPYPKYRRQNRPDLRETDRILATTLNSWSYPSAPMDADFERRVYFRPDCDCFWLQLEYPDCQVTVFVNDQPVGVLQPGVSLLRLNLPEGLRGGATLRLHTVRRFSHTTLGRAHLLSGRRIAEGSMSGADVNVWRNIHPAEGGTAVQLPVSLAPGQQALEVSGTRDIKVLDVDVAPYVAWHEGKFYFVHAPLNSIMEELARWYDVEVVFENPAVREECFTIEMQRFDDFNKVLRLIERTGMVTISVDGHIVTVK